MSKIIGIDLGTSTSEVAILHNGKPNVINNKDGKVIIPSIVGISDEGDIIVGDSAKNQLLIKPNDTVMEVKRLMGTNEKVKMNNKQYTAEEVSSYILKYIKEYSEDYLGESIERAVITVPAYFTDDQRRATVKAGEMAGLKVERIINEPTAAALAYGIEHMEDNNHILVYDLGGGTLDVTLLEMFEGVLEVKASSGNNKLGGKDFDEKLMNMLIRDFQNENNIDINDNVRAKVRIKEAAENCKIALSSCSEYVVNIPFLFEKDGDPVGINRIIKRSEFEELVWDLVTSTQDQIDIVLKDSALKSDDIDIILLVGGSTKVPIVKQFLRDSLNQDPKILVDPDLAVVMGAAVQAAIINDELSAEQDILITDVCPYTLGIETMEFMYGIPMEDVYDIVIPRNLTIPVIREKIYSTVQDNQEQVDINIFQGESKKASLNNFIGKFKLNGVPSNKAYEEKIKVKFIYDINGILNVEAQVISTGKQAGITIETTGVKFEEEIDLSSWKTHPKSKRYKALINSGEVILDENFGSEEYIDLDKMIRNMKKAIINQDDNIDEIEEQLIDILYNMEDDE